MKPKDVSYKPGVVQWLQAGDPAIRWQVMRDILGEPKAAYEPVRTMIATSGWGARFLALQDETGTWANGLYGPKWTSTTYTMLQLRRLGLAQDNRQAKSACELLLSKGLYTDGGINYFKSFSHSETCVTAMVLSLVAYFRHWLSDARPLVDYLLQQQMNDGGWNCDSYNGATHSSFHTTISALEGLREWERATTYRRNEIQQSRSRAVEFLLVHRLCKSHRTGEVFDPKMTRLSFPPRWKYDILRVLDFFAECNIAYDERMSDAFALIRKKEDAKGRLPLQQKYSGRIWFDMEEVGKPSRWNTLRWLRVKRRYTGALR
ncbi:MAG: hypothetical protein CL946_05030 [Ectothiorhodospiraceae bacterium]|nr:hypothetical protein [Ectothiorhodospiraceae bacterium]